MGLHRDPAGYGLPPFEVEQRRRLWWTIVSYDRRIGEMTGSTVTALSSGGDCKLPLNVNDSDLHIDGKELPASHNGATEMLFALTRLEIAMAVSSNSNRDSAKVNPDKPSPGSSSSGSKQTPAPSIRIAGQDAPSYTLDGFCAHIEGTYLQHCDPKIPLHFFTITMTRTALSKMRVINYLMRLYGGEDPLRDIERENLFLLAVEMVEYDNVVHLSESLKPYKWFTAHHFPFPAYMFLVQELRQRCFGPMVDRAWEAIAANHKLRHMINTLHNPMHTAFGRHFIKAWDAHVEASISNGKEPPPTPQFIIVLREIIETQRRAKSQNLPEPMPDHAPYDLPRPKGEDTSPDANIMMTPPSIGPPLGSSAASSIGIGGTPVQDTSDMDWSYLVSDFPPGMAFGDGFQGYNNFAPFGLGPPGPMNRMGGMGGPGSGGMY